MAILRRFWPLLLLAMLAAAFYAGGLQRFASFTELGQQQATLRALAASRPLAAPIAFAALYATVVTLMLPVGALLSVAGGAVFGTVAGSIYSVLAATVGGTLVFLLARSVLGDVLGRRAGAYLERLRPRLQRDGFSYLLALRLLPVVPFWLLNLASALAGMRLAPYVAATLLGIAPATTVYVSLGAGLGDALAEGRQPDLGVVLSAPILLPLLALAVLAMLPVGVRRWRERHG